MRTAFAILVAAWLIIGLLAAIQRGYFSTSEPSCATVGSTIVTVIAGPLNYIGANPEVECPDLQAPQPSE